jgi:hypothetical protein
MAQTLELLGQRHIRATVSWTLPLEDADEAPERLRQTGLIGRAALRLDSRAVQWRGEPRCLNAAGHLFTISPTRSCSALLIALSPATQ